MTTGTCAAAAAGAAAQLLSGNCASTVVEVALPRGAGTATLPVLHIWQRDGKAGATVRKPPNDDPDVTQGLEIGVELTLRDTGADHLFVAGPGVGTITRPGLAYPPGEAAINPVPRRMIALALENAGLGPCEIKVSVENGAEIAQKTFNPRLGIEGGISILGTTGIVRPYCRKAMCDSIRLNIGVVRAQSDTLVLVPGNIGYRSAQEHLNYPASGVVEIGNEWEIALHTACKLNFSTVVLAGHPGKLTKLAMGQYYTHSHHSSSALPYLHNLAEQAGITFDKAQTTAEGFFATLQTVDNPSLIHILNTNIMENVYTFWQNKTNALMPKLVIHLVRMDGTLL